ELVLQQGDRLLHPLFGLELDLFAAHGVGPPEASLTPPRRDTPRGGRSIETGRPLRPIGGAQTRIDARGRGVVPTQVPIGSPAMARSMSPSFLKLNTRIGSTLSRHMPIADMSMTFTSSRSTWS